MLTISKPPAGSPGDLLSQIRWVGDLTELLKDPDTKHRFDQFTKDVADWLAWKDEVKGLQAVSDLMQQARDDLENAKAQKQMQLAELREAREEFDRHQAEARAELAAERHAFDAEMVKAQAALDARTDVLFKQESDVAREVENVEKARAAARAAEVAANEVRERFEEKERQLKAFLGG